MNTNDGATADAPAPSGTSSQKLFAFWEYDQFPGLLGGEVVRIGSSGYVETKEYGKGYMFKPVRILPLETGKELLRKLMELRTSYRQDKTDLRQRYDAMAKKLSGI